MNFTTDQILSVINKKEVFALIRKNTFSLGNTLPEISKKSRFHNYIIELVKQLFDYDMKEIRCITVNGKKLNYLEFNSYLLNHLLNEFIQYKLVETFKGQGKHGIGIATFYAITDKGNAVK